MDITEAITTRRSHRRFTQEKVSEEHIHALLNAAFCAPSAHNFHPLEFIVIKDKAILSQLSELMTYGKMLAEAPCAMAVLGRKDLQVDAEWLLQDASAATENILIQANGLDLGAVWLGVLSESNQTNELNACLQLPNHVRLMSMVAIGHPPFKKEVKDRFEVHRVHQDTYKQTL